jgi:hypothetical protein
VNNQRNGGGFIRNRLKPCDHPLWLYGPSASSVAWCSAVVRGFFILGKVIAAVLIGTVLDSTLLNNMVLGNVAQDRNLSTNDGGAEQPAPYA